MRITQVYIDLEYYKYSNARRVEYQLSSNYLTLHISEWLKSCGLDLGKFNRFIFEEGATEDMQVSGDRAFVVGLTEGVGPSLGGQEAAYSGNHDYFVSKYLEGFRRIDTHFGLSLSPRLECVLDVFSGGRYVYEKSAGRFKSDLGRLDLLHRYWPDRYELVVQIASIRGGAPEERVLLSLIPDPFKVHYHVAKIEVEGRRVTITNRTDSGAEVREL